MVIAFLDLLGFSWLVKNNIVTANDNLNTFNRIIQTKIMDNRMHPVEEYSEENGLREFARNAAVSSFDNMISISDSLVIGATDADLFVKQISGFIATTFFQSSESFRTPFSDLEFVENKNIYDIDSNYQHYPHMAFPILFRGGISFGDDIVFHKVGQIWKGQYGEDGLNVRGLPYVEAVKLEKSDKGPRLFCNKKFVDSLENEKHVVLPVKDDIYEIIWTYYACETSECRDDKMYNVRNRIEDKLLIRAVNLYNYFYQHQDENRCQEKQEYKHYEEFILLICKGIIKYASHNNLDLSRVYNMLEEQMNRIIKWENPFNREEMKKYT